MAIKATSVPTKTLASSINAAATSFRLNNIEGWDGDDLVAGDFGDTAYCVFRNAARTQIEIMKFDPTTIASADISILKRGLQFDGDLTTEVTANKLTWVKGDTFVDLGTDTPQLWQTLKEYIDAAAIAGGVPSTTTILGLSKMSVAPASAPSPIAVGDNDPRVPTQAENDAMAGTPGTPSSTNKFVTQAVSITAGETINGATLPVPVYQNTTDNEYYACDGNDTTKLNFQGFSISNGTDGNSMNIQTNGIVGGFTGLDEGVRYYLSDTAGTIQNTPGTYEILVGIGISTTQLLIHKGRRYANGRIGSALSGTTTTTITVGFRVSKVNIHASGTGTHPLMSAGGYVKSAGNRCVWIGSTSAGAVSSGGASNAGYIASQSDNNRFWTIDINNITNTTFDIVATKTGTPAGIEDIYWEAESDI